MTRRMRYSVLAAAVLLGSTAIASAGADPGQSAKEAGALVSLMKAHGLSVTAAPDPSDPDDSSRRC